MKHHKFAYYAKNRKLFIRFSVVLFSSLMLILFSLFMQIRVFETKKDHNEDLYGSWYASVYDVTKENENMLYDHQMLDTIGKMSVYGQVQYNDEYAGRRNDLKTNPDLCKCINVIWIDPIYWLFTRCQSNVDICLQIFQTAMVMDEIWFDQSCICVLVCDK